MNGRCSLFLLAALLLPRPLGAHPMGAFSVNHYAAIVAAPDTLSLRYLLDLAEIPSLPLIRQMDRDEDSFVSGEEKKAFLDSIVPELAARIDLRLNGRGLALETVFRNVTFLEGEGGLSTVVIGIDWIAAIPGSLRTTLLVAEYEDRNFEGRLGWKEISIDPKGTTLLRCSVDPGDPTERLTIYPQEYRDNPPREDRARFYFGEGEPPPLPDDPAGGEKGRLADLILREQTPRLLIGALATALFLGALHALEPGHGKTLVAAYLVGARGTVMQAVLLGLVVTVTHTASVFLLGLITLYASKSIIPERVYPYLAFASGILVLAIGLVLLRGAVRRFGPGNQDRHDHPHRPREVSLGTLLALGVTGGLVPCPSALVVLLAAVALGRVALGLALIVAFSAGLALVLVAIGTLFVVARPLMERLVPGRNAFRWLRLASSIAITLLGVGILLRAGIAG